MKTDLNYIKKLVKIIDSCDINEIEIDEEGTKIRVVKNKPQNDAPPQIIQYAPPAQMMPMASPAAAPAEVQPKAAAEKTPAKENLIEDVHQ